MQIQALMNAFAEAHYGTEPVSLLFFATAILASIAALTVWTRERGTAIGRSFVLTAFVLAVWAALRGLLRGIDDPEAALVLGRYIYALTALTAAQVFEFHCRQVHALASRRTIIRATWVFGVAVAVLSAGTPLVVADVSLRTWGYEPNAGILGFVSTVWVAGLFVLANLDLYRAMRASRYGGREHRRLRSVLAAHLVLHLGVLEFAVFIGLPFFPPSFVVALLYPIIHARILWRYGLLVSTPQAVANDIVELVRGALLVLDPDGQVKFANSGASTMLARSNQELVGGFVSELLSSELEPRTLTLLSGLPEGDSEKHIYYTVSELRQPLDLQLSVSRVVDHVGRHTAYVCHLRDVTEQLRQQQRRLDAGLNDPLTGLPSRATFLGVLDAAARSVEQSPQLRFGVACIGIDRFNAINEDLGQQCGDDVLTLFGQMLRSLLRPQDVLARLGGDEFAVLLTSGSDTQPEQDFADSLMQRLREPMVVSGHSIYLSASVGVVSSEARVSGGADVLRHAGIAMHRVKERGGGGVEFISQATGSRQRTQLETELRTALESKQLVPYYQPIVDGFDQTIIGFEALVRWKHPRDGVVAAGRFIEFAEEIGLAPMIDRVMLEQACADVCAFRRTRHGGQITVNVNVDESELMRPQFSDDVALVISQSDAQASWLQMEILERAALAGGGIERLHQLADAGFRLCVDDFGTGYSTLSRLHELPVKTLKIDRSFVRGMLLSEGGRKVVRSIVLLAQTLDLRLVSEGVSSEVEVHVLKEMGCRLFQGFYYSPAVPRAQALEWLEQGVCPVGGRGQSRGRALPGQQPNIRIVR